VTYTQTLHETLRRLPHAERAELLKKALDAALADLPPGDAAAIRAMSRQLSERVRKLGELTALEIPPRRKRHVAAIGAVWSEDGR